MRRHQAWPNAAVRARRVIKNRRGPAADDQTRTEVGRGQGMEEDKRHNNSMEADALPFFIIQEMSPVTQHRHCPKLPLLPGVGHDPK